MKKLFLIPFIIVLVSGLILGSCAAPAPAVTTLKYAAFAPGPPNALALGQNAYMDEVEARSGGLVVIEKYWMNALIPGKDAFDAVSTGIADVA